jgi:uncharacterized membrane protein
MRCSYLSRTLGELKHKISTLRAKVNSFAEEIESTALVAILTWILLIAAAIVLVTFISFFILRFVVEIESQSLGTFGDFLGGSVNPILSFMSLIALLLTIILQNKELQETRIEIRFTREAQQE